MNIKKGKRLSSSDLFKMDNQKVFVVGEHGEEINTVKLNYKSRGKIRNVLLDDKDGFYEIEYIDKNDCGINVQVFEYIDEDRGIFQTQAYKGYEIAKMIKENIFKGNEVIISSSGTELTINNLKTGIYTTDFLIYNDFTIKAKKEYLTFDQAKLLGIPYHKTTGYNYGNDYSAKSFVLEMDKKVWEVKNND